MAKPLLWIAAVGAIVAAIVGWSALHANQVPDLPLQDLSTRQIVQAENADEEGVGFCGWQHPDEDMRTFFPGSTGTQDESVALSPRRALVEQRLGRRPTNDEMLLQIHRVLRGETPVGCVLTRRLRGEGGAMELVLAVGPDGRVGGARVQRLREPDSVARVLQSPSWLRHFQGRSADSPWQIEREVSDVPLDARGPARILLNGAHDALILLAVSSQVTASTPRAARSQGDPHP